MLQLPNVGKGWEVQGCAFPQTGSRIYGEHVEAAPDQLARLTLADPNRRPHWNRCRRGVALGYPVQG